MNETNREQHEASTQTRLESYLIFVRHGEAEKLAGADADEKIDAARRHTPVGEVQVTTRGKELANKITLRANDLIIQRSSKRTRTRQTVSAVVEAFINEQIAKNIGPVPALTNQRAIGRDQYNFGNASVTYATGGARRGTTKGLSEEWTRDPSVFQADITASGLSDLATEKLTTLKNNFQKAVFGLDHASKLLAKRWHKNKNNSLESPRLIVFVGSHGFVSEPWLKEVVAAHEQQTGRPVKLELGYGENFIVHLPANTDEDATLEIDNQKITIPQKLLKNLHQ